MTLAGSLLAEPTRVSELSDAEQAVYRTFLQARAWHRHQDTPFSLSADSQSAYDWANRLTPESYDNIRAVFPELEQRVQQGREFRASLLDRIVTKVDLAVGDVVELNVSRRVNATYRALVRAENRKQDNKIDPYIAAGQAYEKVREQGRYPVGSSPNTWSTQHQAQLQLLQESFKEEVEETKPIRELSPQLFDQWKQQELARLDATDRSIGQALRVLDTAFGKFPLAKGYAEALLNERRWQVMAARLVIADSNAKSQRDLTTKLEDREIGEEKTRTQVAKDRFGTDEFRSNGKDTKVPRNAWLNDLGWWGTKHDYEEKSSKGEKFGLLDDYWTGRKQSAESRPWFMRNPDLRPILDRENYQAERREKWWKNAKKSLIATGAVIGIWAGWMVREPVYNNGAKAMSYVADLYKEATKPTPTDKVATDDDESRPHSDVAQKRSAPQMRGGSIEGIHSSNAPDETLQSLSSEKNLSKNDGYESFGSGSGGSSDDIFRIVNVKPGVTVPTEFEIAYEEDSRSNRGSTHVVRYKDKEPSFTLESAVAQVGKGGKFSLPRPSGFDVRADVWADGEALSADDYRIIQNDHSWTLELKGPNAYKNRDKKLGMAVHYIENAENKLPHTTDPSKLPDIPLHRAGWISALQSDAGYENLSTNTDKLVGDAVKNGKALRPEALVKQTKNLTIYDRKTAAAVPSPEVRNPLLSYRPYYDPKTKTIQFECDGSNDLTADELNEGWKSTDYTAKTRGLYMIEPGANTIRRRDGHQRIYAGELDRFGHSVGSDGYVIMDATPTKESEDNALARIKAQLESDRNPNPPVVAFRKTVQELSRGVAPAAPSTTHNTVASGSTPVKPSTGGITVAEGAKLVAGELKKDPAPETSPKTSTHLKSPGGPYAPSPFTDEFYYLLMELVRDMRRSPDVRNEAYKQRLSSLLASAPPSPEDPAIPKAAPKPRPEPPPPPPPPRTENSPDENQEETTVKKEEKPKPTKEKAADKDALAKQREAEIRREAEVRRQVEQELATRHRQNQLLEDKLRELRIRGNHVIEEAASLKLKNADGTLPHTMAVAVVTALEDFVEGRISLEQLIKRLETFETPGITARSTLPEVLQAIKDLADHMEQQAAFISQKAKEGSKAAKQWANYVDPEILKKARKVLEEAGSAGWVQKRTVDRAVVEKEIRQRLSGGTPSMGAGCDYSVVL